MRLGVVIVQDEEWARLARKWSEAEDLGFSHAWVYDHLGWRDLVAGPWFDGPTVLALAATATASIQLGIHVLSPNFRHPVLSARQLTTVDWASGGRLIIGVGRGGSGYDEDVLGEPRLTLRERADRYKEFVELLAQMLIEDVPSFDGRYYRARDARSTPGCLQKPRAPLVLAGNGRESIRLAAQVGDGWITNGSMSPDIESWWQSVAEQSEWLSEFQALRGSGRDHFRRYISLDPGPVYSFASVDAFDECIERAYALGFTDVICTWPRTSGWFCGSESMMHRCVDSFERFRDRVAVQCNE